MIVSGRVEPALEERAAGIDALALRGVALDGRQLLEQREAGRAQRLEMVAQARD